MAPAAMIGVATPRTSSRTTQGTESPDGLQAARRTGSSGADDGLGAHERDARRHAERRPVEDVVEALVGQQHQWPGDHDDHAPRWAP